MAYNRCVGTRYARTIVVQGQRFNFFDYNQRRLAKSAGARIYKEYLLR
jgi:hypothetical protein